MLTIKGKQVRIKERPVAQFAILEIELCGQAQVERKKTGLRTWCPRAVFTCKLPYKSAVPPHGGR